MIIRIEADDVDLNKALIEASKGGYIEVVKILIDVGATNFDEALYQVEMNDLDKALKILTETYADDLFQAMVEAANCRDYEVTNLLRQAKNSRS